MNSLDTSTEFAPPRPKVNPTSQPFWDALSDERVVVQRCDSCAAWVHYPRNRCPFCGGGSLHFEDVVTTGRIYSFTIARQATAPHFAHEVPQVIAIVEPDGADVRFTTTIVTDDPESLTDGDPVAAVFEHGDDGITLLRYRPITA